MTSSESPTVLFIHGSNADHWTSIIRERCNDVDIVTIEQCRTGEASLENVTGLIGWNFPSEIFLQMPNLRWIQFISVGIEELAGISGLSENAVVTNTKGLYADSVADYIIWAMLTLTRKFDVLIRNQSKRRWRQISGPSLRGKTLGIFGVGSVGRAVARRAKAFEMKTVGIVAEKPSVAQSQAVDGTVALSDLHQIIGELDVLVICVPLTSITQNALDSDMIAMMKPTAYLIDTSRAGVVDECAVRAALKNAHLAGATLDVFEREPLRRWSPLWKTANLLITPHIAAITDDYRARVGELICRNVDRFSAGETLQNIVDLQKGY